MTGYIHNTLFTTGQRNRDIEKIGWTEYKLASCENMIELAKSSSFVLHFAVLQICPLNAMPSLYYV